MRSTTLLSLFVLTAIQCSPRTQDEPKPTETMERDAGKHAEAMGWITMRWTAGIRFRARRPDGTSESVREAVASAIVTVAETPIEPDTSAAGKMVPIDLDLGGGLRLCMQIHTARMGTKGERRWLDMSGQISGNWTRAFRAASDPPTGRIDAPITSSVFVGEDAPVDVLDNRFLGGDKDLEYQVFSQREIVKTGGVDETPSVAPTTPVTRKATDPCSPSRVLRRMEDVPSKPAVETVPGGQG